MKVQVKGVARSWLAANLDAVRRAVKGARGGELVAMRVDSVAFWETGRPYAEVRDVFATFVYTARHDGVRLLEPAGPRDVALLESLGIAA